MALEEYKRKRDFRKTPEPVPDSAAGVNGHSYLIQKHNATRLHYDFRLELDGVLLSWAVTKGPSRNPSDKRLAVRTEDHPVSYGSFEGTIPEGEYGGGTVMLWDRGTWEPKGDPHEGLTKGHLAFSLHGERLQGAWNLVRMHGNRNGHRENWLLIKQKDSQALDSPHSSHFLESENTSVTTGRSMDEIAVDTPASDVHVNGHRHKSKTLTQLVKKYPRVQLATLVDWPPPGNDWLHEVKFDGYRLLGYLADGQVLLQTRNENDWTQKFPSVRASLSKLKAKSAVLDFEAVALDRVGRSDFQTLQQALGEGGERQRIQGFVFDLLYLDGRDLSRRPLIERKRQLEHLLKKSQDSRFLHYSDHVVGQGKQVIEKSCAMGLEGVVSKMVDAPYLSGRQRNWLKSKCIKRQEFVIIGYTAAKKGNRAIGALHLGYNQNGHLQYAGKVGTGFGMRDADELYEKLAKLETKHLPVEHLPRNRLSGAHWVKPSLLCEVAFTEWTSDGYIRHPSFQGLREDKPAQEVKKENPVIVHSPRRDSSGRNQRISAGGVNISHPERVLFEGIGFTKGDLANYYAIVAAHVLEDIKGHPVSLLRCPEGTEGQCFFQRSPGTGLGPDVHSFHWKNKGRRYEYIYIEDEKGLLELIQMGTIELHPWGACADNIDHPDRLIFDLDPDKGVHVEALKLSVQDLRQRLKRRGLESFLKCTGGKGLHVSVPLVPKYSWKQVKGFCEEIASEMVKEAPSAYVATMSKAKRKGKIFVDYFRNDYTATAIADFSVRARPGAPVAVPLDWSELKKLRAPNQFSTKDVLARLKKTRPDSSRFKPQKLPL